METAIRIIPAEFSRHLICQTRLKKKSQIANAFTSKGASCPTFEDYLYNLYKLGTHNAKENVTTSQPTSVTEEDLI